MIFIDAINYFVRPTKQFITVSLLLFVVLFKNMKYNAGCSWVEGRNNWLRADTKILRGNPIFRPEMGSEKKRNILNTKGLDLNKKSFPLFRNRILPIGKSNCK